MRKIKSVEEMLRSPYWSKAEIRRLFRFTYYETLHVFNLALDVDRKDPTPGWYISGKTFGTQTKVRAKTVCKILKTSIEEIAQQNKSADSVATVSTTVKSN